MQDNVRFRFNDKTYVINFVCSYGGALSRSGVPAADYQITGNHYRNRFATDDTLTRGGIERTALAAWKRAEHTSFQRWLRDHTEFRNVGEAYRAIRNWR